MTIMRVGKTAVPYTVTWTSEERPFIGYCPYACARAICQPISPGIGKPIFAKPHSNRQREVIAIGACDLCGKPIKNHMPIRLSPMIANPRVFPLSAVKFVIGRAFVDREAPRDGTVIVASIMRICGVPDTGHYDFERMSYRKVGDGFEGWHPVDKDWCTTGESCILAWWPDGTPEDEMDKAVRTNFKYQPCNGSEGEWFCGKFCFQCARDETKGKPCDILSRSFAHSIGDPEYPAEWTFDKEGQPICTAFVLCVEREAKIGDDGLLIVPARCTETTDLFSTGEN